MNVDATQLHRLIRNLEAKLQRQEQAVEETKAHIALLSKTPK